jgi:predicted transcriptional regulator
MRRSVYWREELSEEFADLEFRREYFLSLIEEEQMEVLGALKRAVKAMGVKEFAKLVDLPASNVSRVLSSNDYKLSTLEKFLSVFGLELSVAEAAS